MNFKGNTGKIITTEEGFVVIKQKSFAFGSYEKKIPYSRIKSIEIDEPNMGTAGYIRIVEFGDERIFNKKKSRKFWRTATLDREIDPIEIKQAGKMII